MSPESISTCTTTHSAQSDVVEMKLLKETETETETELTLGLPGTTTTASKRRRFWEANAFGSTSSSSNSPAPKVQTVGWPPVRASRKNAMSGWKYVKVAVDGAPYLRKVDLEKYESYDQLLLGLESMFSCFTIRHDLNERKLMDIGNGAEYVPTYEDKDGDWMLVGDVPWKMFVKSCKRIRLMMKSEATGLEIPKADSKSRSSSNN